jgi:DNA polymerase III delta subunit
MVYLFIGEDHLSKDFQLQKLKESLLNKKVEPFNLDLLYAKDLRLKDLQEKFLSIPFQSRYRLIVIKEAQALKQDCRDFILGLARKPAKEIMLVLDASFQDRKDVFFRQIARYAKVMRFKEKIPVTAFTLSRAIESRRPDYALRVLGQLLREGERPERILGGLRYSFEQGNLVPQQARKRLRLLLNCDIEIKTGRLKAGLALEKLILSLCQPVNPFG